MPRRKIPVRKHHGIRDPLKQREEREKKLQGVVNNPPSTGNDQKLSFKFTQFQKLIHETKAGKKFKKNSGCEDKPKVEKQTNSKSKNTTGIVDSKTAQPIKQYSDEADVDYLKRVNRMTSAALADAKYSVKYGVNVIRDPNTGKITIQKRPKNEIDELLKQKAKEKKAKKHGKRAEKLERIDPKMAKQLIKEAIKCTEDEIKPQFEEYKHDVIQFGEVVHAPPSLLALPRHAEKSDTVPRPGKKSLLLKKILTPDVDGHSAEVETRNKFKARTQLQGKRKDLPLATRTMLENEQSKIVELYRQLRKSNQKQCVKKHSY